MSPPGTATPDLPSAPEVVPTATTPAVAAHNATGRALLRERRYVDAGRAFAAEARTQRSRYTIQVLVACSDETLDKTLQGVGGEEWFIVPVLFKGRACHRLCWGTYSTPSAAEDAQSRLPEYFRSGGAVPRVVPLATILP
jgi:septal ring-binding cell division protein DamX